MLYVVVAHHDSDVGKRGTVFFASKNIFQTVQTARTAEKLGFRFIDEHSGITIFSIEPDHTYYRTDFLFISEAPIDFPAICHFFKRKGVWEEEWHHEHLRRQFAKKKTTPQQAKKKRARKH
ncbi:MAG: hypothetical protein A3D67_04580 [Candidatus Lloydbacteria bacterium RIFCSPHIGHO2_02_FULL_51_22]|uniref:Uncharacterized protein n=3 Tax=Candidatus Lloydiibacteriota TaxID=1817910 RepID=A0A1G2DF97_9BACT|nr:MAG: hypothetical protein A3D67_04580 [Candidatus Lloydbacteria bacterium RIFCSPHIGHO2_02_FULL_51_22]OGZ14534.1 MAG: hypothetical protein A3J08_02390 [Candidatus Lloydbacteria bacterium RIFCSPLOWO2_02_FULL_51_11]OGZ16466.1 MAG: hypothetical protein A3G11_02760 [Candidatus Lloydbacteria bacterium RIFCSPLOWO2_12_FULL_51_9]